MALSVGELVAYLRLDKSNYDQGLGESEKQTGKFRGTLGRVQPAALAVSAGIAAVGAAAWGAAKSTADHADRIAKTSRQLGINAQAYQELEYALGQYGLSTQDTDRAIGRLNQRIGLAVSGNDKYADAFAGLGVAVQDTNGDLRDTDAVMMDTIEALSQIEDPALRSARASEIFGTRMARKLMPALEDGSAGIDDLRERARELGIVMDDDALTAAEDFGDALDDFQRSTEAATHGIGAALLPILIDLMGVVQERVVPAIQSAAERVVDLIDRFRSLPGPVQEAVAVGVALVATLGPMLTLGRALLGPLVGLAGGFLGLGKAILLTPVGWIVAALALLGYGLYQAWQRSDEFRSVVTEAWEAVKRAAEPVADWLTGTALPALVEAFNWLLETAGPALAELSEWLAGLFDGETEFQLPEQIREMVDFVVDLVGGLVESVTEFTDQIRQIWDEHGDAIMTGVGVVWGMISGIFEGALTIILGLVQGVWTAISGIISGALDIILGLINVFIGVFTGDWGTAWEGVQQIFSGIWTAIGGILDGALTLITGLIQGALQIVSSIWSATWSASSALVSSIWSGILSLISGAVSSVVGFVGNLASVPGMIGGFFSSAASAAASAIGTLIGHVSGIPGRIRSALGNVGTLLRQAGRNVITGLLNGIKSMFGSITSTMTDAVSRIRDFLPFSPARVGPLSGSGNPEESGSTIVDMLADGLSRTGAVDRAMTGLASRMSIPASAEVSAHAHAQDEDPYIGHQGSRTQRPGGPAVHIDRFEATEHMSPRDVGEALYALVTSRG